MIRALLCATILGVAAGGSAWAEELAEQAPVEDPCAEIPWAPGVSSRDPLVFTYLYYWYSDESLTDPQLAQLPPRELPFHWRDPAWYARELADMRAAGIDVALAVYWGSELDWSQEGLDALVWGRTELLRAGATAPAIGLFFDTNFLALRLVERPELSDLTDDASLDFLADEAAAFFGRVPACHRLTVDGRPVMFFWRPDTEDGGLLNFAGDVLTTLEQRIEERVGERPMIVRERTWDTRARELEVALDPGPVFGWGAALAGPLVEQQTVAVGPGYDDRRVDGRLGYTRDREQGGAFQRDLRVASLSGSPWLLLETWNEQWEATAIAETVEHGRGYIDIAHQETTLFRRLSQDQPRDGWVDLGTGAANYLQLLADAEEERGALEWIGGRWGSRPHREPDDGLGYFHFGLPPRLQPHGLRTAVIEVEYFDAGTGHFRLQYESLPHGDDDELYTESEPVAFTQTGEWRTHRFTLPDVSFQRRQYGGYGDFRIQDLPPEDEPTHIFGRVTLRTDRGARPVLLGPMTLASVPIADEPLRLRWSGVDGATAYHVELTHLDGSNTPRLIGDTSGCASILPVLGRLTASAANPWCDLAALDEWPPGLYQWRVEALSYDGQVIGTPSDWAYLVRR